MDYSGQIWLVDELQKNAVDCNRVLYLHSEYDRKSLFFEGFSLLLTQTPKYQSVQILESKLLIFYIIYCTKQKHVSTKKCKHNNDLKLTLNNILWAKD